MYINSDEVNILAKTIYGEARGEPILGQEAVACVVLNRVKSPTSWWGNTIKEVCLKKYQFSCWNYDDPNRNKLLNLDWQDAMFRHCIVLAVRAVIGDIKDFTGGATHYHHKAITPDWAEGLDYCLAIGNHLFYNNVE